jgi:EpsI family protein
MQNTKIYPLIGLIMVFTALLVNHAVHRLQEVKPQKVPIDDFPRIVVDPQGDEWRSDKKKDIAVPLEVQNVLKTAEIIQRHYIDSNGIDVVLMLLTASDYNAFHDPTICFPGQGWNLTDQRPITIKGQTFTIKGKTFNIKAQTFNSMVATRDADRVDVLYWMPVDPMATGGATLGKVRALRKLVSSENSGSLFVRMTTPDDANSRDAMISFATACKPYLDHLSAPPSSVKH